MLRIVLFLSRIDYGTMLNIFLFLWFTSGTALARVLESLAPESLAKAPSSLFTSGTALARVPESLAPESLAKAPSSLFTSGTALARVPESLAPESLAKAPSSLFTSGTAPESLAKAPSSLLSETHNKSVTVAVAVALAVALAVGLLILGTCWWYCRKARPPTRTDKELTSRPPTRTDKELESRPLTRTDKELKSNPGLWVTYPVTDLNVATNNFSDSNVVGEGGFGRVYRADLGGNRIAAVKRLRQVDSTLFGKELSILLMVPRHPNIVNLIGICSDPDNQMIVFEYVANGTLFSRLHENQGVAGPLCWPSRKKIARQVAEALRHLHEQANPPIIHRDVKSKNVLLEKDLSAKLADFGIAKLGPRNNRSTDTTPRGTFGYMDPQCVSEHRCSAKSDVYSFGVLLLELITGSQALIGTEALVMRTRTDRLSEDTNNIIKIVDQSLTNGNDRNELLEMIRIANRCLREKREERPTMTEVVNMMDKIGNT